MTQLVIGIMGMQPDSVFDRRYAEGISKTEYWDAVYEDSMNLIARLPRVAAYIYRRAFKDGDHIEPDTSLDYSANYAHMLGNDDEDFRSLMRLYLTISRGPRGWQRFGAHRTPRSLYPLRPLPIACRGHERAGRPLARPRQPGSDQVGSSR